uniref:GP73.5 n=1 Tax=Caviid herpesvirus 2 str. CIDMTR TaxID=1415526 RepID=U6H6D8_9BETA|nr:GP73.5 [Caviid herpesvirus 2 str. CIDMTR]
MDMERCACGDTCRTLWATFVNLVAVVAMILLILRCIVGFDGFLVTRFQQMINSTCHPVTCNVTGSSS